MHKKEWVTLSSSFFLHTHCSILCKTKYSYQTNVQKNKNPNIFRFRLLFPPQTVKYFSFHCKNSHSVKLLSWAIRFTPHSMKQFLFVKHTRKHRTRGRALPLLFFFNQLCSVKCFYSDWLKSQPVKLPRFSPPSLDETRYNSKLFLDLLVVKPSFKSLGIQVSFSSCLL